MHDALISALGARGGVGVVSALRRDALQGRSGTTAEIAEALHVDAVIEGTVFRDGDRMRINVQMVEPVTLRYLWAQTYERDVKDVLSAQKDIVAQVATEVDAALKPAPRAN